MKDCEKWLRRVEGTVPSTRHVIVSLAALSSAFLWHISPGTNFLTAFACGLVGMIVFAIYGQDLNTKAE